MNDIILDVRVVVFSICNDALQVLVTADPSTGIELPGKPVTPDESLEDAALRANRLGLLATLHQAMNRVADLSRLSA